MNSIHIHTHPALRATHTKVWKDFIESVLQTPGRRASSLMEEVIAYTSPTSSHSSLYQIAYHLGHIASDHAFQHKIWRLRRMKRSERIDLMTSYFYEELSREPLNYLPQIYRSAHQDLRSRRRQWFATFAPNPTGSLDLTVTTANVPLV